LPAILTVVSTQKLVKKPVASSRERPRRRSCTSRLVPIKPEFTSLRTTASPSRRSKPSISAPVGSERVDGEADSRDSCSV